MNLQFYESKRFLVFLELKRASKICTRCRHCVHQCTLFFFQICIGIESFCDELQLFGIVVAINMEPLALEYEGCDEFTYTLDFKFTNVARWRVKCVHSISPELLVSYVTIPLPEYVVLEE